MSTLPMRYATEMLVPVDLSCAWEIFSNTERFNRFVGLPEVTYRSPASNVKVLRPATARMLGMKLQWTEYPFEWIEGERHSVVRLYDSGPVTKVAGGVEFEARGDQTLVRFVAE